MTHEIKQTDKTALFAAVPENTEFCELLLDELIVFVKDKYIGKRIKLPPGEWELIGLYPGLTEEQAQRVVEAVEFGKGVIVGYRNYSAEEPLLQTALESLATLMQRERLYTVNPYGEKEPFNSIYDPRSKTGKYESDSEWREDVKIQQEAQARTSAVWAVLVKKGGME